MMKRLTLASAAILAVGVALGFSQSAEAKKKEYPACSQQPTVAVDQFRYENIYIGWDEFAGAARDVAVNELTNSGCFRVVERGGAGVGAGYDREQFLQATGQARPGQKKAKGGNVTLASRIVQFALTGVSKDNVGGSFGGLGVGGGKFGLGAVSPKSSNFRMTCRMYDSSTSEVLASTEVSKNKVDIGMLGAGGGSTLGFGGDFWYKNPVGKAVSEMIHDCAVQLAERTQNMNFN
ncbi:MAG TPA: CsgG/HfaB family protein [bacterium]|nr:CsgG/HfaB family protein [bacterium]